MVEKLEMVTVFDTDTEPKTETFLNQVIKEKKVSTYMISDTPLGLKNISI